MKVEIYTTETCSYCKLAKQFFSKNNIQYTEYDVGKDESKAEEMVEKSGQRGTPVIVIDGQVVVGFDEDKLKSLLKL